jgi:hypothetical protein
MSILQTPVLIKSFQGDTALTAGQVVISSTVNAGNVMVATAITSGNPVIGVVYLGADEGQYTDVMVQGIASIQSDGSAIINQGSYIALSLNGQVKAVTPASGTNLRSLVGIALTSAPATPGALVDVLLTHTIYIGA